MGSAKIQPKYTFEETLEELRQWCVIVRQMEFFIHNAETNPQLATSLRQVRETKKRIQGQQMFLLKGICNKFGKLSRQPKADRLAMAGRLRDFRAQQHLRCLRMGDDHLSRLINQLDGVDIATPTAAQLVASAATA